jgi:transposase
LRSRNREQENGVRENSLWRAVFGVEKTVIEDVEFDADGEQIVVSVRPTARQRGRCGRCRRPCRGYDQGRGQRRRWRGLDLGAVQTWLEADAPRVACPEHGVVVAHVPWARHGAGHTHAFDQQVAWLATRTSKSAVVELMRVAWRTVGAIITRVWADVEARTDPFEDLTKIGIDEISYKRGHLYLTVVVDHTSGRLVWAAPGQNMATLQVFFDRLGPDRCAKITHVSADAATWIANAVAKNCPQAVKGVDPFHVVKWANDALGEVRAQSWKDARRIARATEPKRGRGRPRKDAPPRPASERAKALHGARVALWKNPDNLTAKQRAKLEWVAITDPRIHRAYQLKEGLRLIFKMPLEQAAEGIDRWISWARRCRIPEFVKLSRTITAHRTGILTSIEHGLSNGRTESVNTKIRLLTRIAFGFKSPDALIALAMLSLGGHRPTLPGRN